MKEANGIAVFLDRDGTINRDEGYLSDPDRVVLIKGAAGAIKKLNAMGLKVIVVSNQSGVGRGFCSEGDVHAVNGRLVECLEKEGARLDGIYFCSHHPEEDCECRKPGRALALKAASEHSIELTSSYVVGDKRSDVELAWAFGGKGVLVLTGFGPDELKKAVRHPDFVAMDICGAVHWIIGDINGRGL